MTGVAETHVGDVPVGACLLCQRHWKVAYMCYRNFLQQQWVWPSAISLLAMMLLLLLGSSREDSLTFDEPAHIAAGYTYLRFRDARLNYEHPPLLKMLAAIPLLRLSLHFPLSSPAWQDANNGQWETARAFFYESGNDPDHIATWARLGPIVVTVCLGLMLFLWAKQWAGPAPALLTLLLYVFSPTILAHGRLVTTDVAAAFGVTLTSLAYIPFSRSLDGDQRCSLDSRWVWGCSANFPLSCSSPI